MKKILTIVFAVCLASMVFATGSSDGAEFPQKPVEIIVPFGAGGGADISVRLLAKYAEEHLGQKIVVNNVTGGSGVVGVTQLAHAKPDGYKLGYIGSTNTNDKLLFEGVSYDEASFVPVVEYAADPHIIVVSKKSGITSMDELIAKAKANPGSITFGLGGAWTSHDFLRISLEEKAGVQFKRMVFQGGAAAINAVAAGDCDVAVPFVAEALAQIDAGYVIPIAITSPERLTVNESIPTVKEEGMDFTHSMWRAIVAPAGTPADAVAKLSEAFEKANADPEYQAAALQAGINVEFRNAVEFAPFYAESHEDYKTMINNNK